MILLFQGISNGLDAKIAVAGGILRCGTQVSEEVTLDPHHAAASLDRMAADLMFNGLLRYKPGNAPHIQPDLAEKIPEFNMVEGKQVWIVSLKKGVMFHSGPATPAYELTADDVVYSLQRAADPDRSAYAGDYRGMMISKVDRYTVHITVDEPVSSILFFQKISNYSGGFIVSSRALREGGEQLFREHPVGTGAFVFYNNKPKEKLELKAHDNYFRGRPKLSGIELYYLPEIKEREQRIRAGDLDIIVGFGDKGWYDSMVQAPGIILDTFGVGEVMTFYLNTDFPPFDDVRVRRAVAYALNRDEFLDTTDPNLARKVFSPVPFNLLPGGISEEMAGKLDLDYATDREMARKLLTEAGYPDGFTIKLLSSRKRLHRALYESLARQLSEIGIKCEISVVAHSEMHKLIRQKPFPIVLYGAWRPSADAYLTRFFHSGSIVVTGASPDTNFSRYDQVDKLIEDARLEIDPVRQVQLWQQAQIKILADMAAYPVFEVSQLFARRSYVDFGHELINAMALYPQFTEKTDMIVEQQRHSGN